MNKMNHMKNGNFRKPPISSRVRRHRRKRRLVLAGLALPLIALIAGIVLLVHSCSKPSPAPESESSSAASSTAEATASSSPTTTLPTTLPTTAASTASSVSSAPTAAADSWFDDACFIGDSRTQGLMLYATPGNAAFFASKGLTVSKVFSDATVDIDGGKLSVNDALGKRSFGKVYIMLGVNELGWSYPDAFAKRYGDLVDRVKETQPNAKIFVQSIFPVSAAKSEREQYINNPRILQYNELLRTMCREKQVAYLNVREAVEDGKGNLPDDASSDGVHLNAAYCRKWRDYLKTHTDAAAYVPAANAPATTTAAG